MKRIFIIGDSISLHYGPYLEQYLKGVFHYSRKEGNPKSYFELDDPWGANGGDSAMVLSYVNAMKNTGGIDADYILINCGLHDLRRHIENDSYNLEPQKYLTNLQRINTVVSEMEIPMIWIQTTHVNDFIHNRNSIVKEKKFRRYNSDCIAYNELSYRLFTKLRIPIIDLYTFTLNLGSDLFCDHVHFKKHVREKQAAYIAGWIRAYDAKATRIPNFRL